MSCDNEKEIQRAEFTKYTKYFTIRLVQTVIQSRLGEKHKTRCGILAERNDWFNLKIEEYGEITNEIYRATENQFPPDCSCISVDFQLQTCDGEKLPLESWALQFDSSSTDDTVGIRSHFYHQLGTLLKSALSASRVTPSYRNYVRRQGADSFIICYRIIRGLPDLQELGDGYRSARIGNLASPFGSLYLDLHYRTNMVISSGGTTTLDTAMKENYFKDISKRSAETNVKSAAQSAEKAGLYNPVPSFGNTDTRVEFSAPEPCYSTFSTSPGSMDLPWFVGAGPPGDRRPSVGFLVGQTSESSSDGSAHWQNKSECAASVGGGAPKRNNSSGTLFKMELSSGSLPKPSSLPGRIPVAKESRESFPFSALLSASSAPTVTRATTAPDMHKLNYSLGELNIEARAATPVLKAAVGGTSVQCSGPVFHNPTEEEDEDSSDDSFVKVEMINPLFSASPEQDASDLGSLVRAFKAAPPQLYSFDAGTREANKTSRASEKQSLDDLTTEIHRFEERESEFDSFVNALNIQQNEEDED